MAFGGLATEAGAKGAWPVHSLQRSCQKPVGCQCGQMEMPTSFQTQWTFNTGKNSCPNSRIASSLSPLYGSENLAIRQLSLERLGSGETRRRGPAGISLEQAGRGPAH